MSRKPGKRKPKAAVRVQYGALPYRLADDSSLEVLLVTTRRTRRWIIPKGWPIRGLTPPKSAAREAFEEAGVRGKIGAKAIGRFTYDKLIDEAGVSATCEVKVFPLLVKSQSEVWPESEQRVARWAEPGEAAAMIKETNLRKLVSAFAKRKAAAERKAASKPKVASERKAAAKRKVGKRKAAGKPKAAGRPKAGKRKAAAKAKSAS
jgi:8-oxo-dGTP pyrophosphatase MutT (NUDIX family)